MSTPKQIIVRTSERSALKRCPQRWWWSWRNGLEPNQIDTKLWMGAGLHLGLAKWYLPGLERGPHPSLTWFKFVQSEEAYIRNKSGLINEPEWIDARDLGIAMFDAYVEHYGNDENWFVIATEMPFQATIKVNGTTIIYTGTFDGVYRDVRTGKLLLMEHKSANQLPNMGYLELDDQAGSYFLFAEIVLKHKGIMKPDEHLDGIMYNFLRKGLPDLRPKDEQGRALNKNGTVSKQQPKPLFVRHIVWRSQTQRIKMRQNIINEVQLMLAYRNRTLRLTKTPTKDCSWDCAFFQMCQLHESMDDWELFRDAMFHKRDPYADHRLAMKDAGA